MFRRTLWFHIIPLLDEDDQEYTKRRLFLFTGRDEEGEETDSYENVPMMTGPENDDETRRHIIQEQEKSWDLDDRLSQPKNGFLIIFIPIFKYLFLLILFYLRTNVYAKHCFKLI